MSTGKSVRLFLADGTPGGLLTAEIMNWTGHLVTAPRSDLGSLLKRPEPARTGVYILIGDDPDAVAGTRAYIGEGDAVGKRLAQHARPEEQGGKDFWDRVVVITSKDANLTKAHARYLESRFISLAVRAARATLTNETAPVPLSLPEADVSDMEYFIEQAKIVLPLLGLNIFRTVESASAPTGPVIADSPAQRSGSSPRFQLLMPKEGIRAEAQEIDGEFTVLKGSTARDRWIGDSAHSYRALREQAEVEKTVVPPPTGGSAWHFARNRAFPSPSGAAAVVLGRSANGRKEWRTKVGEMTYGDWQRRGVDEMLDE